MQQQWTGEGRDVRHGAPRPPVHHPHLEDGAHFSELLPRPQEPEGQDGAHMLRDGVEVRDETVRNLPTETQHPP